MARGPGCERLRPTARSVGSSCGAAQDRGDFERCGPDEIQRLPHDRATALPPAEQGGHHTVLRQLQPSLGRAQAEHPPRADDRGADPRGIDGHKQERRGKAG